MVQSGASLTILPEEPYDMRRLTPLGSSDSAASSPSIRTLPTNWYSPGGSNGVVRQDPAPNVPGARTSSQRGPFWLFLLLAKDGLLLASHCTFHSPSLASPAALNANTLLACGHWCAGCRVTVTRFTQTSGGLAHKRKSAWPLWEFWKLPSFTWNVAFSHFCEPLSGTFG